MEVLYPLAIPPANGEVPDAMPRGEVFILPVPYSNSHGSPFVWILACPECGTLGYITARQALGCDVVICGSDDCSMMGFFSKKPESDNASFTRRTPI